MREIKFRVWDKKENRWNENGEDYTNKSKVYTEDCEGTSLGMFINFIIISDYILVQYTGKLDKNGKEIYEGDIVKTGWYQNSFIEYDGFNWLETLIGKRDSEDGRTRVIEDRDELKNWEVIGNIYENKELLSLKKI